MNNLTLRGPVATPVSGGIKYIASICFPALNGRDTFQSTWHLTEVLYSVSVWSRTEEENTFVHNYFSRTTILWWHKILSCLIKMKKPPKKQYQILTPSCYLLANLFLTLTLQFLITDKFSSGYSLWSVKSFQIGGFIHQVWVTFGENVVNVTGEATVSNRSSERHSNLSPSVTILWKYLCSEKKAYELWEAHVYVFNNRKFYNKKDFFEF